MTELSSEGVSHADAQVWAIDADVAWMDSGHRVVAMWMSDPSLQPFALEGSAAVIWRALAEPTTVPDLVARVSAQVDLPAQAIRPDVERFVDEMARARLVAPVT